MYYRNLEGEEISSGIGGTTLGYKEKRGLSPGPRGTGGVKGWN